METLDITKLGRTELQSLAYEQISTMEVCQKNLVEINAEIMKIKVKEESEVTSKTK